MNIKDVLKKLFPDKVSEIDSADIDELKTIETEQKNGAENKRDFKIEEIELLKEQNKVLLKQINELKTVVEGEKTTREETLKNIRKDKINDLLDNAIKTGQITPDNRNKWADRFEKDFDGSLEIIKELPINKTLQNKTEEKKETGEMFYKNTDPTEINMDELIKAYSE